MWQRAVSRTADWIFFGMIEFLVLAAIQTFVDVRVQCRVKKIS